MKQVLIIAGYTRLTEVTVRTSPADAAKAGQLTAGDLQSDVPMPVDGTKWP